LSSKKSLPWFGNYASKQSILKRLITGIAVPSKLAIRNLGIAPLLMIVLALLTIIFWGNVFRFSPGLIDRTYDGTSDGMVIGRLARSAADGFSSGNLTQRTSGDSSLFQDQIKYFDELVDSLRLEWWPYSSQWSGGLVPARSA
jgi:hypothetical protein